MNDLFIVVDTETTNSLDDPICYDVGFAVVDSTGFVHEKFSYVVAEIFLDEELMASAYFLDKIPQYWQEIKEGKRVLAKFSTIRFKFAEMCKKYKITKVCAHNARFDYRSLNLTQRFLTSSKHRYFFPYNLTIYDTLKMARLTLNKNDEYGEFCYNNGFLTQNQRKKFTAEVLYRFISQQIDFEESHTGLEDVLIEKEILIFCIAKNPASFIPLWDKK